MEQLKTDCQDALDHYGTNHPTAQQQIWTVVEDQKVLENATKSDVRRMFNEWVNSPEAAAEQPDAKIPPSRAQMSRYFYCMHVDEESLRSTLDDADDWHVNTVNRKWVPEEEEFGAEESDDDEEFLDEVREADIWSEIEGCTEEDVGWVKASIGILVSRYVALCDPDFWYTTIRAHHRLLNEQHIVQLETARALHPTTGRCAVTRSLLNDSVETNAKRSKDLRQCRKRWFHLPTGTKPNRNSRIVVIS